MVLFHDIFTPMSNYQWKMSVFIGLIVLYAIYTTVLYFREYKEALPADKLAQTGKIIWQQKNCVACHQLYGLGGHLGPDLTNVYGHKGAPYIKAFLQSGTQVMPNYHLSESEMQALISFLKYTNSTGIADPNTFTQHPYGTISAQ
ncbi:MAG: cytochrome c [Bacteroidia bacterium]|nr:cytochrome c [Bacteroidia bacterium]